MAHWLVVLPGAALAADCACGSEVAEGKGEPWALASF